MRLTTQLKLYDRITKEERRRIEEGYYKYKDSFLDEDLVTEAIEELLDLFGYLILMQIKRRNKNGKVNRNKKTIK